MKDFRPSFIFHTRWAEGLSEQPGDIRLEVYDAVIRYATTGYVPKLRPMAKALFRMIKLEVDEDVQREAAAESKRREYMDGQRLSGRKGAEARWGQCAPEVPEMGFMGSDRVGWGTLKSPSQPIQSPILPQGSGLTETETEKEGSEEKDREKDPPTEKEKPSLREGKEKDGSPPPPPAQQRFIPPTMGEVEDYAAAKGLSVDASRFCDFYESKGWRVGSSPMKDWRAAVRNWAKRSDARPRDTGNRGAGDYSDSEVWGR